MQTHLQTNAAPSCLRPRCAAFAHHTRIFASHALAEDVPTLVQLARLTVQKGFKNISLGDVCDRLHIGVNCEAGRLNVAIVRAALTLHSP